MAPPHRRKAVGTWRRKQLYRQVLVLLADEGLSVAAIERKLDLPKLWVKRSRSRSDDESITWSAKIQTILDSPAHQNRLGRREQAAVSPSKGASAVFLKVYGETGSRGEALDASSESLRRAHGADL